MDAVNPLMPAAYDLVWSAVALVAFGLVVWAIVSLSRRARPLPSRVVLMWALVIVVVPILGPVAWLAAGRRAGVLRS
ncbi:PLD nuclease N-terminal domain-containing protein [uncultured Microbacterium sp.]|uniref:PLD nuclease N-terminal domain-containing protein n=1 Tax=uncultured Microbacterium sp. TaxID=191216 RepID=UPI0025F3D8FC|nr:PLD nuclease N-terminal domain-containing protein [uncultured Microbacterium sp.]